MGWEGVREQKRERERGREHCWKSCSIKNLTAFPNSSRGKKVSQDAKSEKGGTKKEEGTTHYSCTNTLTLMHWSPHPAGSWAKQRNECPDIAASPREGWRMEIHALTHEEWWRKENGWKKRKRQDWRQCCPARSATICKIRWLRGKVLKLFHFCCLP